MNFCVTFILDTIGTPPDEGFIEGGGCALLFDSLTWWLDRSCFVLPKMLWTTSVRDNLLSSSSLLIENKKKLQ